MFYEEKQIDGMWYWRETPTGEWLLMGHAVLNMKLDARAAQHATVIASWKREELEWEAERDGLTARVAGLEKALKRYSWHGGGEVMCERVRGSAYPCTCGLEKILTEFADGATAAGSQE